MKVPVNCDHCGELTSDYGTKVVYDWYETGIDHYFYYCVKCYPDFVNATKPLLTKEDFWRELE